MFLMHTRPEASQVNDIWNREPFMGAFGIFKKIQKLKRGG